MATVFRQPRALLRKVSSRCTVNSQKSEHADPHTRKGILQGIPTLSMLKPCYDFQISVSTCDHALWSRWDSKTCAQPQAMLRLSGVYCRLKDVSARNHSVGTLRGNRVALIQDHFPVRVLKSLPMHTSRKVYPRPLIISRTACRHKDGLISDFERRRAKTSQTSWFLRGNRLDLVGQPRHGAFPSPLGTTDLHSAGQFDRAGATCAPSHPPKRFQRNIC